MSHRNSRAEKAKRRKERARHDRVVQAAVPACDEGHGPDCKTVVTLSTETWEKITEIPGLPGRLLTITETSGRDGVVLALAEYGLGVVPE